LFAVLWKISGVAIGSGWQALVAYVNLACYYVIGLTVGCVLGFKTSLGVAVSLNNSLTDFSVIFVQS
jgi:Na+-driven multidrug efflux pump